MPATRAESPRPSLLLMIVREGDRLCCTLTDGGGIGLRAELPVAPYWRLEAMAASLSGHDGATQRQTYGGLVYRELLPLPVRQTLARLGPCDLTLQLAPDLAGVTWELAFDGELHLDERHAVARRLIDGQATVARPHAGAPRELLRVLMLAEDGAQPVTELLDTLQGNGLRALLVDRAAVGSGALQALLHRHDVLHLVGGLDGAGAADPASAALLPLQHWPNASGRAIEASVELAAEAGGGLALVVLQATPSQLRAALASRSGAVRQLINAGVPVLLHAGAQPSDPPWPGRTSPQAFLSTLYPCLGAGLTLGESVRRARLAARAQGEPCAHTQLLGNPSLRLLQPTRPASGAADHVRQVTVLSCDLVDSTRLMHQLGDEAYSEQLARYHAVLGETVAAHGGRADDPQGDDGVMCYFGFPQAIENAAVLALRAGLQILARCAALGLPVRLGAATGQVVVKSDQPVGAAVHYAARLQAIAPPGQLIASEATWRVVAERFEFESLGAAPSMKGFDQPGEIYRVLGESTLRGTERFDRQSQLAPFVGRVEELAWLRARSRLDERADPRARALLVLGEAGIGKSRLVREFRRGEAGRGWRFIEWRCAPEQATTAWFPVTEFLGRYLRFRDTDSAQQRRDKIAASDMGQLRHEQGGALLAQLLSVHGDPAALAGWSSERQRRATMDLLLQWMWQAVEAEPVCLVVEDLHWIDPSTRALIARALSEGNGRRLLLLMTSRPEPGQDDSDLGADTLLLPGLTPDTARQMVDSLCGARRIDPDTAHWLLERADGVPLFLEESTRMLLDLAGPAVDPRPATAPVPATIHDLLMARLDRAPAAKRLAQVASVIGREFTRSLLGAVVAHTHCPVGVADLDDSMATLVQADLLIPRGSDHEPLYLFRHALLRDAAYGSLWERDRRRLHGVIAEVIELTLPHVAEAQPELLARHLTEAGLIAEAVAQWERAARRSAARSAHLEAIADLETALVLLDHMAPGLERERSALRLNLLLASRLIATEGYGADRVEHVYGRALDLARQLGDDVALAKALFGLEGFHFMRADFDRARQIGQQAGELAQRSTDPMARLQSQWSEANLVFHQGDLIGAVDRMNQCLADYRNLPHRPSAVQDPGVMCLCYSAWALWQLGQPDEALRRAEQVVELARGLKHRFSMAEAYGFLSVVHFFRGENEAALQSVQQAIEISQEGGFSVWLAHAEVVRGRLLVQVGDVDRGVALLRTGYQRWVDSGAVVTRSFYLALWAQGEAAAGRSDQALALLAEALELVATRGERYFEPELLRLSGEFQRLLALGDQAVDPGADPQRLKAMLDASRDWLAQARERAAAMGQHGIALRVAISRLRLEQDRQALRLDDDRPGQPIAVARVEQARRDLEEALAAIQGGRGSRDVLWAEALLARLSGEPRAARAPLWIDADMARSFDLPTLDARLWPQAGLATQDSG
ncbi:AAA family ATPase [Sphaerotilus mobilis]|uniref:Putative ATPase n=1 Tax=Sphaerotilus mobilis TaxID=47994 RepID=A0A4Q7LKI5_9BURK|nr:AAA family ATPase [Sphaerotilus mobilis]RZS54954.1 putative ATPase [Sphaerotilus mobilis]